MCAIFFQISCENRVSLILLSSYFMGFADPQRVMFIVCRWLIWLASWIVPGTKRIEWRRSWTNQVWHWCQFLAESGRLNREKKLELALFCWSAFPAAFWLRFDRDETLRRADNLRRSPWSCLGVISALLIIVLLGGRVFSTVSSYLSSPIPQPNRLCVISLNGKFRRVRSDTLLELASAWKDSKFLGAVAAYSWGPESLDAQRQPISILTARVAPGFFQVLQLQAAIGRTFRAEDEQDCRACIVLSDSIWHVQFHGDPAIIGRQTMLDGSPRTVIGVLPRNFHLLSPEIAVWTLLDSGSPFSNFVERIGAVARMKPGATKHQVEADLVDLTEDAGYVFPASMLVVTSGAEEMRRYLVTGLLFVLLAVACSTFIVYMRSGAAMRHAPVTARQRFQWWLFFVAKSVLLLLVPALSAWTVVRWLSVILVGSIHPMTNAVALWLFLVLSIAPLSWAIYDQQRRCRVCLRRLGTPIRIGSPGYVLLDWSGTEMVCPKGHGILYLPDSQANWLERDRWNNLDDSWAGLFRD